MSSPGRTALRGWRGRSRAGPPPRPAPGEALVLVLVLNIGICGTDVSAACKRPERC